jgi:DNA-binding GntR family transcriptional regulator
MAEFAGYPSLVAGLRKTNFFWLLCRAAQARKSRPALQRDWHTRLLDLVLGGDPEAADRAMREHIRDSFVPFMEDLGLSPTTL